MATIPLYLGLSFIFTTGITLYFLFKATQFTKLSIAIIILWMLVQFAISQTSFYSVTNTFPPRFAMLIVPPLLAIILIFSTSQGKRFISSLNINTLTLLHSIRIPVELVLYGLFYYKAVPVEMTFEGRNFDILVGLSAPLVYYLLIKNKLNKKLFLIWNLASLALLLNIVAIAILSAKTPIQCFGFNQPNIAITLFPFVWLPSVVVPIVLFSHLVAIKKAFIKEN